MQPSSQPSARRATGPGTTPPARGPWYDARMVKPAATLTDLATDRATAARYVEDLFRHLLGQAPPPPALAAWTDRAMALRDPLAVFDAFAASPAVQDRQAQALDTATRWPPGHFYSPVASRREVAADRARVFAPRPLPGLDLRDAAQEALFARLAPHLATLPFSEAKAPGFRYHYDNPSYNFGDAAIYWAMLHELRPRRIIEVGSGFSSALALDTIDRLALPTVCTFIDPFPEVARAATDPLRPPHDILPQRVQAIDLAMLDELGEDDLLFIDSSHVLKTGSDVHFELTRMLPRLAPGVVVHFHDMFEHFEYPERWVLERNHGWNELYALHAFLLFNGAFQVEFFNHHFARRHAETVWRLAAGQARRFLLNPGGGLWLRRHPGETA